MHNRYWTQKELYDGTYDLSDLLDIHEVMETERTNKQIYENYIEAQGRDQR